MSKLKLVNGVSAKAIKRILEKVSLDYKVIEHSKKYPKCPYFKDTAILADSSLDEIIGIMEEEPDINHLSRPGCTYFALYTIPGDFDFTYLNGPITFENGNLVERTRIYFKRVKK